MTTRRRVALIALTGLAALALAACSGSSARTVTVTHGPVQGALVKAGDTSPAVGDVRYFEIATKTEGDAAPGRLDAMLTTTGVDTPDKGSEIRIGRLVFTFATSVDQIVVDGVSAYPAAGSTIAVDTSTIRPITGGAGAYAGARGWCESFHLADGTWKHVMHLLG